MNADQTRELGVRLAVETLYSHALAHRVAEHWAQIAHYLGLTYQQAEKLAFDCAAAGINPFALTSYLSKPADQIAALRI